MKTCSKCGIEKDFSEFYKNKCKKDCYNCQCKDCLKQRRLELKTNPTLQLKKAITSSVILENKILSKENKRLCPSCKNIFHIEELNGCRCEDCKKEYDKSDKRKQYEKSDKRKESKIKYIKEYRKSDKYKEYQKEYRKKQKELKAQNMIQ